MSGLVQAFRSRVLVWCCELKVEQCSVRYWDSFVVWHLVKAAFRGVAHCRGFVKWRIGLVLVREIQLWLSHLPRGTGLALSSTASVRYGEAAVKECVSRHSALCAGIVVQCIGEGMLSYVTGKHDGVMFRRGTVMQRQVMALCGLVEYGDGDVKLCPFE